MNDGGSGEDLGHSEAPDPTQGGGLKALVQGFLGFFGLGANKAAQLEQARRAVNSLEYPNTVPPNQKKEQKPQSKN